MKQDLHSELSVEVANMGGIDTTTRHVPSGTTVLVGENATNRSSFLRALATGLGVDFATLKGDAPEGGVTIKVGEKTYSRTLRREGQKTVYEGNPYLTDPESIQKAKLFAFLLRDNPIRHFARGSDGKLRDLLMEPVDTDTIEDQINELLRKKRQLEDDRDTAEKKARNISALTQQRGDLDAEIETLKQTIDGLESEIASFEQSVVDVEEENAELTEARKELNQLRQTRTTLERKLSNKQEEKEAVEAELDDLTAPGGNVESLERRKAELENEMTQIDKQIVRIESEIKDPLVEIRGVVTELKNESSELRDALSYLPTDELGLSEGPLSTLTAAGDPTERLLDTDSQICLACGGEISSEQIEKLDEQYGTFISEVNTILNEKRQKQRSIETELDEVRTELTRIETYERTNEDLKRRKASLETDLASLSDELSDVIESFDEQRAVVRELGQEENDELIELHEELAEKRARLEDKQKRRETLESSIETARSRREEVKKINGEISEIEDEIKELRSRVRELERSLKEAFNEHIKQVIEILDYENLEGIEIRDRKAKVREGRRTVEKTVFDLHITREGEEGTYRGSLEHLSESETELVGIIIALSGYLVHEVGEFCPVMILDSVDALDARRLQRLLDYIEDHQTYLVTAVHPEDASTFDTDQHDFTMVDW